MTQPKKPKQKNYKLVNIAKKYNDINKLSTHVIDKENNLVIKYYETFDNKRIENLMKESYSALQFDAENKLNFFKDGMIYIQYVMFLILKHMTSLKTEIPDTLDKQIPIFNQIISIGLFEEMFNEVFPPDQVSIVLERISNFASLAQLVAELKEETRQEAIEAVQHPVIKKKLTENIAINNA